MNLLNITIRSSRMLRMKYLLGCIMLLCSAGVLAEPARPKNTASYPFVLKDDLGYTITISQPPKRIISLAPSNTEILFALGLEDKVIAVTNLCDYPPSVKSKPHIGGMIDFSAERILSLEPDFVFAVRGNSVDRLQQLQNLRIPLFAFDPVELEDIFSAIEKVGLICNVKEAADELTASLKARIKSLKNTLADLPERKRVYIGSLQSPYYAVGTGTFLSEIIELAGGENIAKSSGLHWPILSSEQILVSNPQAVFFGLSFDESAQAPREQLLAAFQNDLIWSKTMAGLEGNLYFLDQNSLHRPGPRIVEVAEQMARMLYPERFSSQEPLQP